MDLLNDYTAQEQLKSLSGQLKHFACEHNDAADHVDQRIKSENLQHNLSLIMAHIILELQFVDRSKHVFLRIVEEYNHENGTQLSFEDFERIHWVRLISDEIVLPAVIQSFVWKVTYDEQEGNVAQIPNDKEHITRCLQRYYRRCIVDVRPTILKGRLNAVLRKDACKMVNVSFLRTRCIIGVIDANTYYWKENDYKRHLDNEISATLWLLIAGNNSDDATFKEYFKLIKGTGLWPKHLSGYLERGQVNRIGELAANFLKAESDLLKSPEEFEKAWLDSPSYQHVEITSRIPYVTFNDSSPLDFIQGIEYYKFRHQNVFDHQATKAFYELLVLFVVQSNPIHFSPYQQALNILKDTSRPYLVLKLYENIPGSYPFLIPYLLTDVDLLPLAFRLIEKIKIHPTFLPPNEHGDEAFKVEEGLKSKFWLQMFTLLVENFSTTYQDYDAKGRLIGVVMLDLAEKVFINNSNLRYGNTGHTIIRKRYDDALRMLGSKRWNNPSVLPTSAIHPRLILLVLPAITNYLKTQFSLRPHSDTGFIHLQSGLLDLSIEMLRFSKLRVTQKEISQEQQRLVSDTSAELLLAIETALVQFYSVIQVNVPDYFSPGMVQKRAHRGVNNFAFEIIDWGYLFLLFEAAGSLQVIHDHFNASLSFNREESRYDDLNKEQYEKIKLYLKSLLLAHITIQKQGNEYEVVGLPVKAILKKLEGWIKHLAVNHSTDEISEERVDVFDERYSLFGHDMYYQSLTTLLYEVVNSFESRSQEQFIRDFFAGTTDVGRMLSAINTLDSRPLTRIISDIVNGIPIEDFIAARFTATELQYALIDAANSEKHWELAQPIAEKLKTHYNRVRHHESSTMNLLFEVNLLLAYKERDFEKLGAIDVPQRDPHYRAQNENLARLKQFFIALFQLNHTKNFDGAVDRLRALTAQEPKSVRYAFQLYRAETLKAVDDANNLSLLTQAHHDWETYVNSLSDDEKTGVARFAEDIGMTELHYFAAKKETTRFDQIVNRLPNRYRYDDEVIAVVYAFYIQRELHEQAHDYAEQAKEYYEKNGEPVPATVVDSIYAAPSAKLLASFKKSMGLIGRLPFKDIPSVVPDAINDKHLLNEFILNEIIHATRVLLDKIQAIQQITHENKYNDLLVAMLRLRLPFYGWSIQDQPRTGLSSTGKDAGLIDFLIQASGQNVAFVEALILRGDNVPYTQEHLTRCYDYIGYVERYYIVIYFLGKRDKFDSAWSDYQATVLSTEFQTEMQLDTAFAGFVDLASKFMDVRHLKIGKTIHKDGVEMFHIMINLGK